MKYWLAFFSIISMTFMSEAGMAQEIEWVKCPAYLDLVEKFRPVQTKYPQITQISQIKRLPLKLNFLLLL